jgi:hypothetical protein
MTFWNFLHWFQSGLRLSFINDDLEYHSERFPLYIPSKVDPDLLPSAVNFNPNGHEIAILVTISSQF